MIGVPFEVGTLRGAAKHTLALVHVLPQPGRPDGVHVAAAAVVDVTGIKLGLIDVHDGGIAHLPQVGRTGHLIRLSPGGIKGRQEDRDQQCDDPDHHQEFDQSKSCLLRVCHDELLRAKAFYYELSKAAPATGDGSGDEREHVQTIGRRWQRRRRPSSETAPSEIIATEAGSGTAETPLRVANPEAAPVGNAAPWMPTLKSMIP